MCLHVLSMYCDSTDFPTPTAETCIPLIYRKVTGVPMWTPQSDLYQPVSGVINKDCIQAECLYSLQIQHPNCEGTGAPRFPYVAEIWEHMQQSAYADYWNDECPAWHRTLQQINENVTEGRAPRSGPLMWFLSYLITDSRRLQLGLGDTRQLYYYYLSTESGVRTLVPL